MSSGRIFAQAKQTFKNFHGIKINTKYIQTATDVHMEDLRSAKQSMEAVIVPFVFDSYEKRFKMQTFGFMVLKKSNLS